MEKSLESLCDKYKSYFPIGTIINQQVIEEDINIILKHFNSVTPENALKMCNLYSKEGTLNFDEADKLVEFGVRNNMLVRGHVLVWHDQEPGSIFNNLDGNTLSREQILNRLEDYIHTVVRRYKDKIYCWDVVNEVIDDGEGFYRQSKWLEMVGEDYIEKAFMFANKADPNALLYYNEYNAEIEPKGSKVYALVKKLVNKGVPIHGIGIQAHYDIVFHKPDSIRRLIEKYADLGLNIQITEMDVSVFDFNDTNISLLRPTIEMLEKQAMFYEKAFEIFREYKNNIMGVTLWGVTDKYTWRDDFPIRGRKDWPMLFNEHGEPKPAFEAIMSF